MLARSKSPLEQLHAEHPEQVRVLAGDLGDLSLSQNAADLASSTWGQIDGLVINHGVLDPVKRISEFDAAEWRRAFDINVFSAIALVRRASNEKEKDYGY